MSRDPTDLDDNEQEALTKISQASPTAQTLYQLVQAFRHLLHQREGEKLDGWLSKVKESQIEELLSFARCASRRIKLRYGQGSLYLKITGWSKAK
jgi:transposase